MNKHPKKKRTIWSFFELDYKAMEVYLEDMAQRGWMLKKINQLYATFEEITPRKVHFTVDVFEKAGALVSENTEEAREYRELCEEAGWHFIDARRHLQFFYSEAEQRPTPIQTDLETEKRIVSSSLWKSQVGNYIYNLVIFSILMYMNFPITHENLLRNTGIMLAVLLPLFWGFSVLVLGYLLFLRYRMKKSVDRGEVFSKRNYSKAKKRAWIINGIPMIFALFMFAGLLADLIRGNNGLIFALFPIIIGSGVGLLLNKVIQKKSKKKSDGILYVIIGILGTFIVISMITPFTIMSGLGSDRTSLPESYPRLESDSLESAQEHVEPYVRYYPQGSLLVPVSYDAYLYRGESGFDYAYHETISPKIAEFIYQELLHDQRFQRHREDHARKGLEELNSDHPLYSLWDVDKIAYDESRNYLLLLHQQSVFTVRGDLDFTDRKIINEIEETFFSTGSRHSMKDFPDKEEILI